MKSIITFFINNSKLNNTLLLIITMLGILFYIKTPKELFPAFELDYINVKGSYTGSSINILDKIAVAEIEDNIKGINGVIDFTSYITPGSFSIQIKLQEGTDKNKALNSVKDAISLVVPKLPSDMDEPTATVFDFTFPVLNLTLASKSISKEQLIEDAKKIEKRLLLVDGVGGVQVFGDSDLEVKIVLNNKKITALGLNIENISNEISKLSYIFPIGKIEAKSKHLLVSTYNGKKDVKGMLETKIKDGDKYVRLGDIATVTIKHADVTTSSTLNGKNAKVISVSKNNEGDVLEISKKIKEIIATEFKKEYKDMDFTITNDVSVSVKRRLNVVVSNIVFGILLIGLFMWILINARIATVVLIGIPTAFIISMVYLYFIGITINIMSLLGILLAVGIVVDDAIVVVERIQYHIDKGMPVIDAAIKGSSEMALPVFISLITTLFSFLPMLMISGELGLFLRLIPITVVAVLVSSYIETFLFLPIHSAHTLKPNMKTTSWERPVKYYKKVLNFVLHYSKTSLLTFFTICAVLMYIASHFIKFQPFASYDSGKTYVSMKLNPNIKIEDSFEILKKVESEILKKKKELFIKSSVATAGFRTNAKEGLGGDQYPYVGSISIEFLKLKPSNFVDKYINPILTLSFIRDNDEKGVRDKSSDELSDEIRKILKPLKKRYNMPYLEIEEERAGPVDVDVQIGLSGKFSNKELVSKLDLIKSSLKGVKGIKDISTNANYGVDELKIKVNSYGESLGLTEASIGKILSNSFLSREVAYSFNSTDMLNIVLESKYKDNYDLIKNFKIPIANGEFVALNDVATFITQKSFERVTKFVGDKVFYIYINIDHKVLVASEVLDKLKPTLDKIRKDNINVSLKGEEETNQSLKNDMMIATSITLLLIILSLLYLFNSFKSVIIIMVVIPLSIIGSVIGHLILNINFTIPSVIGALGLAGVIINNGILVILALGEHEERTLSGIIHAVVPRFRPILITSITTLIGLSTLIFFATGQAKILQPLAVSLGFGLLWGTILNLILVPLLYYMFIGKEPHHKSNIYKILYDFIINKIKKNNNAIDNKIQK